jgi:hypothetical protein
MSSWRNDCGAVERSVQQPVRPILCDLAREQVRKRPVVEQTTLRSVHDVVRELEIDVEDDAKQPVSADDEVEESWIFRPADLPDGAVGEHDAHRPNRAAHRSGQMVHAVRVDRDRAADRKDVGGLHGANRKLRMDSGLDVVPGGAAFHGQDFFLLVDRHAIERAHVEDEPARRERLSAHAVPDARHRHLEAVLARERQRAADVLDRTNLDDSVDGRPVETARVVNRAATLRPREIAAGRHAHGARRTLAAARQRLAVFGTGRFGGVLERTADRKEKQQAEKHRRNEQPASAPPARAGRSGGLSSHRGARSGRRGHGETSRRRAARPPALEGPAGPWGAR